MPQYEPKRENYRAAVEGLHARTALDRHLGMRLETIEPGRVVAELVLKPELTQQHGFAHAGVLASLADSACGNAAYSLMAAGEEVLEAFLDLLVIKVFERPETDLVARDLPVDRLQGMGLRERLVDEVGLADLHVLV